MSDPDLDDRPTDEESRPQGPRLRGLLGWILIGSLTIFAIWAVNREFDTTREISRHDLERLLANPDALKEFYIHGDVLSGKIRAEYLNEFGGTNPDFTVHLQTDEVRPLIERITQNKALLKVFQDEKSRSFRPEDAFLWQTVIYMLPWLMLAMLLWLFISRQMRSASGPGGVLSFGRSRARLVKKERVKVTFDDVAGIDDAKEEVQEVVQFLKHPEKFQALGGRIPRGVMLVGPPGSGKTLLAKAIAGEANVPFFSISGSDFVEMFVGVGASRVRDLFRTAKESSPCIIFLDEIDAVGRRRGMGYTGGHDEREQTLNAILVEMDGFETNEQVIIIGATNRPDVLDPALRRPGRFDREVVVSLPDIKEREAILKVHAKKIKLAPHADLNVVARGTPGFSGADLAAIINESAIHATMLGKSAVEQADLEESRDKVRWGRTKRSRAMDEQERRNIAYHEAGHALVNILLEPDVEPLHKVSIIPRGLSLGATMFLPEKDRYTIFRRQVIGEIKVAFGGRIAEELFVGDISSGAADDIRRATQIARRMVTDWGMSDRLGPIRYASNEETTPWGAEFLAPKEHSDATAREIDQEVQRILGQAYAEAKHLLDHNREALGRIAETLLKKEVMTAGEVRHVIDGLPLEKTVPPAQAGGAPAK
jgi:cell division protease FtsH